MDIMTLIQGYAFSVYYLIFADSKI